MPVWFSFLKKFLNQPLQTGALIPSGPRLVSEMLSFIPSGFHGKVVEIGLGSGVITQEILNRIGLSEFYIGIELNEEFYSAMKARFPKSKFVHDSAENILKILGQSHCVDRIVCSLPWAFMPSEVQLTILKGLKAALSEGGMVTTYLYLQSPLLGGGREFLKNMKSIFPDYKKSSLVLTNIPPAYVYQLS